MAQGYFNNLIRPFRQNININYNNIPPQPQPPQNGYPMYPYEKLSHKNKWIVSLIIINIYDKLNI